MRAVHVPRPSSHRKAGLTRTSFALPQETLDRFRELAESEHRTVSAELRRLMERRLAEAEALKQAA